VHHRPGHSPTDTVFHDRDRRILIAADHLLTLSEVLGHIDLMTNEGRVREVARDGVSVFEAGGATGAD
jgi:glyoxylase-like metal-dependent hydrolase (beta-lactamase superfamily II)